MKKSIIVTLMPLLFICATMNEARAEDSVFTVTSFIPERFRDFEWRIEGSGSNLNQSSNEEGTNPAYPYVYTSKQSEDDDRTSIGLRNRMGYTSYTTQRYYSISLGTDFTLSKRSTSDSREAPFDLPPTTRDTQESDVTSYTLGLRPGLNSNFYLLGDFYAAIDWVASLSMNWSPGLKANGESEYNYVYGMDPNYMEKRIFAYERKIDGHSVNLSNDFTLSAGWGRKYDARFAGTSLYMIDELRNNGLLEREPTKEQMERLTEIVYQNRLKHVIDSRIRQIESLDEIIVFLKAENILKSDRPMGYLLIQDVWQYFPNYPRYFGWRFSIGPRIIDYFSKSIEDKTSKELETITIYHPDSIGIADSVVTDYRELRRRTEMTREYEYISLAANLEYYRPLNLRWQVEGTFGAEYFIERWAKTPQVTEWDDYYSMMASGLVGYRMNSRSSFSLQFHALYRFSSLKDSALNTKEWQVDPAIGMEYRLAIPTTLRATIIYSLFATHSSGDYNIFDLDRHHFGISASIFHYLY